MIEKTVWSPKMLPVRRSDSDTGRMTRPMASIRNSSGPIAATGPHMWAR